MKSPVSQPDHSAKILKLKINKLLKLTKTNQVQELEEDIPLETKQSRLYF